MQKHSLLSQDNQSILVRIWPCAQPQGTVQILHGMAEHCERYDRFARFLNQRGFTVISHNHRGHGERQPLGHFADQQGWQLVLNDVEQVQQLADKTLPLFLFGHSMGSFIARDFAAKQGQVLSGLLLCGSNQQHPALFYAGKMVAHLERALRGGQQPSKLLDFLSFGSFNQHFKPNLTAFDWLSGDPHSVQQYLDDPLCGNLSSTQFWLDFFGGLIEVQRLSSQARIPAELPILLLGGDQDPVGRMGKGMPALAQSLTKTGHSRVSLKGYPEGRHELLNERNADQVMADIGNWLEANCQHPHQR